MGDVVPLPVHREQRPAERSAPPERRDGGRPEHVVEPLWRESVGRVLRGERLGGERRLVDVAEEAGVSPQYLSEVERGLKDPSSELLAAIAGALGLSVAEIATRVSRGSFSTQSPVCLAA
jgi:DNA-binding XRE family transcriptional regulator